MKKKLTPLLDTDCHKGQERSIQTGKWLHCEKLFYSLYRGLTELVVALPSPASATSGLYSGIFYCNSTLSWNGEESPSGTTVSILLGWRLPGETPARQHSPESYGDFSNSRSLPWHILFFWILHFNPILETFRNIKRNAAPNDSEGCTLKICILQKMRGCILEGRRGGKGRVGYSVLHSRNHKQPWNCDCWYWTTCVWMESSVLPVGCTLTQHEHQFQQKSNYGSHRSSSQAALQSVIRSSIRKATDFPLKHSWILEFFPARPRPGNNASSLRCLATARSHYSPAPPALLRRQPRGGAKAPLFPRCAPVARRSAAARGGTAAAGPGLQRGCVTWLRCAACLLRQGWMGRLAAPSFGCWQG